MPFSAADALPWLRSAGGNLQAESGPPLRLLGLHLATPSEQAGLAEAEALLVGVAPGQRCVALRLSLAAQTAACALPQLDAWIARGAASGIYTLLRFDARLWLHGHHLPLARRYAATPGVLYALAGRPPLAERLWQAAQALRAVHPRAFVWLPLESAQVALRDPGARNWGLLWDASHPQAPAPAALTGALHVPVLLDAWEPGTGHPLAHERLMALCRQAHMGWLAHSASGWTRTRPGLTEPNRAAHALRHAVYLSTAGAAAG